MNKEYDSVLFLPYGFIFRMGEDFEENHYYISFVVVDKGLLHLLSPVGFDNYDVEQNSSLYLEPGELSFVSVESDPEIIEQILDNGPFYLKEIEFFILFNFSLGDPKLPALSSFLTEYGNDNPKAVDFLQDLFDQCLSYSKSPFVQDQLCETPNNQFIFPEHNTVH